MAALSKAAETARSKNKENLCKYTYKRLRLFELLVETAYIENKIKEHIY